MRTPAFSGSAISVASHNTDSREQSQAAAETTKQHEKPAAHGKTAKIPRPPNAFILYRQHHQPEIKATYPDFCNNDICTSTHPQQTNRLTPPAILLGKQWRDETDAVKAHYKAQAEELKRKHARDHPDYQYSPRRPSEKKRRASSRQYPKHAKMLGQNESQSQSQSPPSTAGVGSNASTPVLQQLPGGFNVPSQNVVSGHGQSPNQNQVGEISAGREGEGNAMNVVLGADGVVSASDQGTGTTTGLGFDADAFSAIMQQVNNGIGVGGSGANANATVGDGRYLMYQGLGHAGPGAAEQAAADSFEFSDFITDFY